MDQIKRQLDFNQSSDVKKKKLRRSTCLEDLSNELFYEFFDYLDGCDIHKAFSDLNIRFQNLLTNSLLPLNINLSSKSYSTLEQRCRHVIIPNKHRIISLHLNDDSIVNDFFDFCNIDSSFNHLESVVLSGISDYKTPVILFYLNGLPRLSSLTIHLDEDDYYNLSDIYRLIFRLPYLKYSKLSISDEGDSNIFIPMSINEKPSTIERLVLNFGCTLDELTSLLLHTPYLQHLTCEQLTGMGEVNRKEERLTLPYLTHISIANCIIAFDEFEVFIKKICSQLQMLRLTTFWNSGYLDAYRWKQLIKYHMPHLYEFHFDDHMFIDYDDDASPNFESINQFTSSFWIERQWFFELENDFDEFVYSIHPYRKKWFNYHLDDQIIHFSNPNPSEQFTISSERETDISPIQFTPPIQLTIGSYRFVHQNRPVIDEMKSYCVTIQFTHLNIDCDRIPIGMFIEIIHLLPNLESLKISSLPLVQLSGLSFEDSASLLLVSITNKITKMKLDKMDDMEQIHFLMDLCPRVQYFEIGCKTKNDLEDIVRSITMNSITPILYLKCLCLCFPNANEKMIENLQDMIDFERHFYVDKNFRECLLRRRQDKIFLNWKL